ncbi:MAG: glycosyltransferase family 4 protein [Ardenticatenaceae bacterium]|nr:glycosyltransferase family 4 protein [Ardenticatenaceae bacterium]
MKIAHFSPLPPQKSGIASYSAYLLPYLAQFADLTLFTDQIHQLDETLSQQFPIRESKSFAGPLAEGFDVSLYHMGNNAKYHSQIYELLCRYPGIVVLHDTNLHSFFGEYLMKQGQFAAYTREMAFAYGPTGLNHAQQAHFQRTPFDVKRFPLFERVVQKSLGIIVHNQYSKKLIERHCSRQTVAHIPHLMPPIDRLPAQAEAKALLGYRPDDILLASFGYVSPSKRIHVVLEALASLRSRASLPRVHYALVGQVVEGYNLQSLLQQLNLENVVSLVGYADETHFRSYLAAVDIAINLRYPTLGETSGTLMALMAAAKPLLVSNIDAFAELPDNICVKIGTGKDEQAEIEAALLRLIGNPAQRQELGQRAFTFASEVGNPLVIAQKQVEFVAKIINDSNE